MATATANAAVTENDGVEYFDLPLACAQDVRLLLFLGPSGSGKSTIMGMMLEHLRAKGVEVRVATSTTTREARSNDPFEFRYRHDTDTRFDERVSAGEFLILPENGFAGNRYGYRGYDLQEAISRPGAFVMFDYVVSCHQQARMVFPDAPAVMLTVNDESVLRKRLKHRGENEAVLDRRVASAQAEMALGEELQQAESNFSLVDNSMEGNEALRQVMYEVMMRSGYGRLV